MEPLRTNTEGQFVDKDNNVITFEFLGIQDCGDARCPHCGAEGRYIYRWIQDGRKFAAMAGCYKVLTYQVSKSDYDRYMILLSEKQSKNKPLNGWDRTVLRMLDFKATNKYPAEWCDRKIVEALKDRQKFLTDKRY